MGPIDESLERLIVRELDGELSDQERCELNKWLLRSPEARALLEEYRRYDELAAAVVRGQVDRPTGAVRIDPDPEPRNERRGVVAAVWAARIWRVAAAACVGLVVAGVGWWYGLRRPSASPRPSPEPVPVVAEPQEATTPLLQYVGAEAGGAAARSGRLIDLPHVRRRWRWRNILLVPNERRRELLVLEFRRTRTQVIPVCGDL